MDFAPIQHHNSLDGRAQPLPGPEGLSPTAWNRSAAEDEAVRLLNYSVFDYVSEAVSENGSFLAMTA